MKTLKPMYLKSEEVVTALIKTTAKGWQGRAVWPFHTEEVYKHKQYIQI